MECSIASNFNNDQAKSSVTASGLSGVKQDKSTKTGLKVNFSEKGEVKERREKFLTAKYGSHQMNLIRKRLAVEMWLYEELQKLSTAARSTKEVEIDIDELLDLDDDAERRKQVQDLMADLMNSVPDKVQKFVENLLEKMKTL